MEIGQHYFIDQGAKLMALVFAEHSGLHGMYHPGGILALSMMYAYLIEISAGLAWLVMAQHCLRQWLNSEDC